MEKTENSSMLAVEKTKSPKSGPVTSFCRIAFDSFWKIFAVQITEIVKK